MHNKRLCLAKVMACAAATVAAPALAAGLGAGVSSAVFGQPLDFVVALRLDGDDSLDPECIGAVVTVGERRLPASQVVTRVERQGPGSARIRIATTSAMDEPVIGIELAVACQVRQSRSYVVLADPPGVASAAAATPAAALAPADADTRVASAATVPVLRPAALPAPPARTVFTAAPSPSPATAVPRHASSRPAAARPKAAATRRARAPTGPFVHAVAAVQPARLTLVAAAAVPEPGEAAVERALAAVAQAASAARSQAEAASAAAARVAGLERDVERLGSEVRARRDEAAQLRQQLAGAAGGAGWTLPLTVLVLLLAATTSWLAWRLSNLQRERQQDWRDAVRPPRESADASTGRQVTSPVPFVSSEAKSSVPEMPPARPHTAAVIAARSAVTDEEPVLHRTEPLFAASLPPDTAARDVSIEELIDLEQQADFFVVLGQDDAAVELLVQHLRDTGGSSPLPYLKLLEIHHRVGDRAAYERMRSRFNLRFNAYAPEWGADPQAGRSLEDYAGILPRLQQVWPRPLDAMAELEALLFRKSRGALFDLPAYREVLFLYALARDRLDHEVADPHNVDVLLPLADGGEFSSTTPVPLAGQARDERAGDDAADARAPASVDLDLTQAARPASIFDTLDVRPTPPRP